MATGGRSTILQACSKRPRSAVEQPDRAQSNPQVYRNKLAKFHVSNAKPPSATTRSTKHGTDVPMRAPTELDCTAKEASQPKRIRMAPSTARATLPMAHDAKVA